MNIIKHAISPFGQMLAATAIFALILSSFAYLGSPMTAGANHDPFGGTPQSGNIQICHVKGNGDYVVNSPNISATGGNISISGGHANHGDDNSGDIIPPFHFDDGGTILSYPGKNWSPENEDIWDNGTCQGDGIVDDEPETGSITIEKAVEGDNIPTEWSFPFTSTVDGEGNFTLDDGNTSKDLIDIGTGSYNFVEDDSHSDWELTDVSCVGGVEDEEWSVNGDLELTVNLGNEDDITCTFTNTYTDPVTPTATGTLVVIKDVVSGNASSSDFTLNVLDSEDATIASDPGSATGTEYVLDVGTYKVTEDEDQNYTASFEQCGDGGVVSVAENQTITCTVQNREVTEDTATGTITVMKKVTEGSSTSTSFTFSTDYSENFTLSDDESNSTVVATGTYSVSEIVPEGWTLENSVCHYWNDGTSTPQSVMVEEGRTVTCIFTNDEEPEDPDALTCSISASENPVNSGSNFNLNWSTSGDDSEVDFATLTSFGTVATSGATSTSINSETTFTLTLFAEGDEENEELASCSETVKIASGGGGGTSGGGGGERIELTERGGGSSNDDEAEEQPEPEVLGEQVSAIPAVAPATGAGGTSSSNPLTSTVALLGMLLSLGALRATRNG